MFSKWLANNPTVETMNFQILCFIKILQPPLGWQNLDRTIAYTRFHRIKGGGGVPFGWEKTFWGSSKKLIWTIVGGGGVAKMIHMDN